MSHTTRKQKDIGKMVLTTFIVLALFAFVFLFAGCSTPEVKVVDPSASQAASPEETEQAPPQPLFHAFGDTVSYDDGISLSVSAPAPYTPTEMAAGTVEGQTVLAFEFVITNNSEEPFDPSLVMVTLSSGGTEASGVFDTSAEIGFPPTTAVIPGQTIKWTQAWSVANPSTLTMEAQVGFTHDPSIFTNVQ